MLKIEKMNELAEKTEGVYITEIQAQKYQKNFESVLRIIRDQLFCLNKEKNVSNTSIVIKTKSYENGEIIWDVNILGDISYQVNVHNDENMVIDAFDLLMANDATVEATSKLVQTLNELSVSNVFCDLEAEVSLDGINSDLYVPVVKVRSYALS